MKIKNPEIIEKEFNDAKNGIDYKNIVLDNKTIYKWKCDDCQEIWETSNYQRRIVKKGGCSYCTNQKVRHMDSLGYLHPSLINEWSSENKKDIFNYSVKYNEQTVKWICQECNITYEQRIGSRIKSSGCICKKQTLLNYKDLAKEIQNTDPSKITIGTHIEFDWKCQECSYIWKETVNSRVNGKSKCPKCNKRFAIEGNTLVDTHRNLMYEWDFEKNIISPFKITSRNHSKIIWWKCEKFPSYHKWNIKLGSRVSNKPSGCPYCSGDRTSILESIISENPYYRNELLANEFDKEKNILNIEEIRAKSSKDIYWKCSVCKHSWLAKPANRTGINETGCPECSIKLNTQGQSIAENKLRSELKKIFNSIEEAPKRTGFKFKSRKEVTVDFFINELGIAFDLDPNHFHKEKPSESYNRDKEKTDILNNYNNFFKLREAPLTKITENDVVYDFNSNNYKELAKLIYIKILVLYPNIDENIKSKLLKALN